MLTTISSAWFLLLTLRSLVQCMEGGGKNLEGGIRLLGHNFCASSLCPNNKACFLLFCFVFGGVVSSIVFRWSSLERTHSYFYSNTYISYVSKEFLLYLIIYKVGSLSPFQGGCARSLSPGMLLACCVDSFS